MALPKLSNPPEFCGIIWLIILGKVPADQPEYETYVFISILNCVGTVLGTDKFVNPKNPDPLSYIY